MTQNDKMYTGKQLGAGAFGVVVKGLASGILPYEEETTVAVKMVKQTADNEVTQYGKFEYTNESDQFEIFAY